MKDQVCAAVRDWVTLRYDQETPGALRNFVILCEAPSTFPFKGHLWWHLGPTIIQDNLLSSRSLIFFFFWPPCLACGILVPRPGIEPTPPAVEARTSRKVPRSLI